MRSLSLYFLTRTISLKATFDHRPWLENLDLVRALESFLLWTNQVDSVEDVVYFDRGDSVWKYSFYSNTNGNGIPDIAEMMLLDHLLKHPDATYLWMLTGRAVQEEFMRQREFILPYLEGEDEDIIDAAAAYLTLGGNDYLFWLRDDALDMEIDYSGYRNILGQVYLSADSRFNSIWFTNLEQWWYTLEIYEHLLPMCVELAENYVEIILDPSSPPKEWVPLPTGTGGEPCGCWNDDYIPTGTLTINGDVEAYVIDPGGCANERILAPMDVPLGRRIRVMYRGAEGWFSYWNAPGTLLDGSGLAHAEFVHVNAMQTVSPVLLASATAIIPTHSDGYVTVTSSDPRITISGTQVSGPANAVVTMDYTVTTPNKVAAGWTVWDASNNVQDGLRQQSVAIRIDLIEQVTPHITSPTSAELLYFTHRATMSGPGDVFIGAGDVMPTPGTFTIARVNSPNLTGLGKVYYRFTPVLGLQVSHTESNFGSEPTGGPPYYPPPRPQPVARPHLLYDTLEPLVAHATLVEMPVLVCSMECMDKPAPPEEIGTIAVDPAGACYEAATPYNQSHFEGAARLITLTASTHCGYEFVRWQGTGDVYDVYGNVRTDVSLQAGDNEPERWVTDKTIRIKMAQKNSPWEPKNQGVSAIARIIKPDTHVITWHGHWDLPQGRWPDEPDLKNHRGDFFKHTFSHSWYNDLSYEGVTLEEVVVGWPELTTVDPPLTEDQWNSMLGSSDGKGIINADQYFIDEHALVLNDRFKNLRTGDIITFRQGWYIEGQEGDYIHPGFNIAIMYKFYKVEGEGENEGEGEGGEIPGTHFLVRKGYGGMWAQCPQYDNVP